VRDRRRRPTPALSRLLVLRRAGAGAFVAIPTGRATTIQYPRSLLILLCGILVLSIADASARCSSSTITAARKPTDDAVGALVRDPAIPDGQADPHLRAGVLIPLPALSLPDGALVIGMSLVVYVLVSMYHMLSAVRALIA
jgi:hypothetical protein